MKSPVLFLIFNRPDTTKHVFEEIRKARPPRLYIAADGPRATKPGEKDLCEQTRAIASKVDWSCEVKTLFRNENLGCGKAVSQAITWFFDNEPEGIILEDDILPHPDFFSYCDELLERYRDDDRIGIIAGHNHIYQDLNRKNSYGFLSVPHIWGWATWRKKWDLYQYDVSYIPIKKLIQSLKSYNYSYFQIKFWEKIYTMMKTHPIDTWDFQWAITLMSNGLLNATPYFNLTKNIGFNSDATHTIEGKTEEIELVPQSIYPILHPSAIILDHEADEIEIKNEKRILTIISILKYRIKSLISSLIGS